MIPPFQVGPIQESNSIHMDADTIVAVRSIREHREYLISDAVAPNC